MSVCTSEVSIETPRWIDGPLDLDTVIAVCEGGCASGAYMPAVEYNKALFAMEKYSNEILDYIENDHGLTFRDLALNYAGVKDSGSWMGFTCYILSVAVEYYCRDVVNEIQAALASV